MAKKKSKTKPADPVTAPAPSPPSAWRAIWFYASLLAVVAAFFGGLVLFNRWGAEQLRNDPRYQIPFREVQCEAPPGMTREEFLEETQYLSRLPDKLFILAPEFEDQLRKAFKLHPWVSDVGQIHESATGGKSVKVHLQFREPVLAVPVEGTVRVVDGVGVLLPKSASAKGLPVYEGDAPRPSQPAGKPWGDAKVEARAKEVKANHKS